ncbi:MAG: hypothetical protein IPP40_08780 [bacterium]|nr:hypothetical protein [bacterium]
MQLLTFSNEVFEHTSENNNRTQQTGTINVALTLGLTFVIQNWRHRRLRLRAKQST